MKEKLEKLKCMDAFQLKLIAMFCMLLDHAWAMLPIGGVWMTTIGRIAFPIFAFQIVEGYFHTKDIKKYLKRLLIFALISEIPFNYLTGGGLLNPTDQNVMFTFIISILFIMLIEKAKKKGKILYVITLLMSIILGFLVGTFTFVDYMGYGVLMVLTFYFFRGRRFGWLGILICMWYINFEMIGGLVFPINIFGFHYDLPEQGFALLALPFIWMYNGKQGLHNKKIQYGYYAFYPAHITILVIISKIISAVNGY